MELLRLFLFTTLFSARSFAKEGCEKFRRNERCDISSENLIFEVGPEVIQTEVECSVLTNSANGSWFNFNQAKGCQVLEGCKTYSPEIGTLTGPNVPSPQDCSWATDIPPGSVLVIGGEYTDSMPDVDVITDDLQIITKLVPNAPDRNVYWTAQKVGHQVIVCGGQKSYVGSAERNCYHLDLTQNKWTTTTILAGTSRKRPQSTLTPNGQMMVAGGDWFLKDVEIFNGNNWEGIPSWTMPDSNMDFCLITHGTDIYIIGGNIDARVVRFDTTSEVFFPMPSLAYSRGYHRCLLTTVNNRLGIMVTGSLYSSNNAWTEFLPLDSPMAWERLGDLKQGRFNHGFEMLGGKPTIFAGEYGDVLLNNFEQYDETTNEWTIVPGVTFTKPKTKFAYVKI